MVTLAIQAGGQSSRMGLDKGLVELGGRPLVWHVLSRLADLADDHLITTNAPESYIPLGVRTVSDEAPGRGPLTGLATALSSAKGDPVLVVACDLPFVEPALAAGLLARAEGQQAVVPFRNGQPEPMLAVYRRSCLPAIRRLVDEGEQRVSSFYRYIELRRVDDPELSELDPAGRSFFNVNTPDDLAQAERILAELSES
jgi:molybdenum cofactor guanylyltransferase